MIPTSSQSHDLRQQSLADPAPSGPDRAQDRPHSRRTTDAHRHRLFGAPRQSPKEGLKQELAPGYAAALVASTSKFLAQINKTPKGGCGPCPKNALWTRELCRSDAADGCRVRRSPEYLAH